MTASLCLPWLAVPTTAQEFVLEEIIVTATHRAENLQDVPVTVTAMGRDQLERADIFDATTIALHVPGMAYGEFAPGQALISLRGIGSAFSIHKCDPPPVNMTQL